MTSEAEDMRILTDSAALRDAIALAIRDPPLPFPTVLAGWHAKEIFGDLENFWKTLV